VSDREFTHQRQHFFVAELDDRDTEKSILTDFTHFDPDSTVTEESDLHQEKQLSPNFQPMKEQ
jgi:hypothetical protein